MKFPFRALARLIAFFLVFVVIVLFANTHFIKTDTYVALSLHEIKARNDIELAFVGSSLVRDHFNPDIISERTGLKAYSAAVPGLSFPGFLALTKELYRTNSPKYTVLVIEPEDLSTVKEDPEAEYKLMPYLSDRDNKITYYLDLCRGDGRYLDRFCIFRQFGPDSLFDLYKTFGLRYAPESCYKRILPTISSELSYTGGGFLRRTSPGKVDELSRESMIREPETGYEYEVMDYTQDLILRYKALCEEKGSELLVVFFPNPVVHALAERNYLPYMENGMKFCRENGIPCFNFQYMKQEYLPILDEYSYDLYHFNLTGANLFSEAFSTFFNRYTAGEDVSDMFYSNKWEYLDTIHQVTNVWMTLDGGTVTADCNRAPHITPLYQFVSRHPDGSETILREYSTDPVFTPGELEEGDVLRVYAKPQDHEEFPPVWYE